jgi:trimeric autotransporter adhesin
MRTNFFFFGTVRLGRATAFAFGAAMIFAVVLFGLQAANPAHAATTFTVNSTGDKPDENHLDGRCQTTTTGECTLRAAIQQANATKSADTINFAILGNGPHTISPAEGLPPVTRPLTIDGYT